MARTDGTGTALETDDAVAMEFTPLPDEALQALVAQHFHVHSTRLHRLPSERDDTVRLDTAAGRFVLKVANPHEDPAVIDMQTRAVVHAMAADPGLALPRIIPARDGSLTVTIQSPEGLRIARLMTYLPGRALDYDSTTTAQRQRCGLALARLSLSLQHFRHPAADRRLSWDLQRLGSLRPLLAYLPDGATRSRVLGVLDTFDTEVAPVLPDLPAQVLHNDFNPGNVLVDPATDHYVTGILDFGETVRTAVVTEVAVAMAYAAFDEHRPWAAPADLLAGFQAVRHLGADELKLVPDLVRGRLAQRLLLNSFMSITVPTNAERTGRWLVSTAGALARVLECAPPDSITRGTTE